MSRMKRTAPWGAALGTMVAGLVFLLASCEHRASPPPLRPPTVRRAPAPPPPPHSPGQLRAARTLLRQQLDLDPPVPLGAVCTGIVHIPPEEVGAPGETDPRPRFHGWPVEVAASLDESQAGRLVAILQDSGTYDASCGLCGSRPVLVRLCCDGWVGDFSIDPTDALHRVWTSDGRSPIEHCRYRSSAGSPSGAGCATHSPGRSRAAPTLRTPPPPFHRRSPATGPDGAFRRPW